MLPKATLPLMAWLCAASVVTASPVFEAEAASPDAAQSCGETTAKVCFGVNGGTSQQVDPADVAYAASYLREIAKANQGTDRAFWNMPAASDCAEWQLPLDFGETVMSLAKHINPRFNSSVLYADLANTIDGGEFATPADVQASLLGCGANGGMMGVKVNASDPAYSTPEYKASGARSSGVLIKIVHAPV